MEHQQSEKLGDLYTALSATQGELESAALNSSNPFFKSRYSDLSAIVKSSRPVLAKNGLCVLQRVLYEEGNMFLATRLCHSSGQWIEGMMPINPPKQDIQTLGSYITYLRRYNYAAIVGVVTGDEDDDGEKAMESSRKAKPSHPTLEGKINKSQLQIISSELDGHEDILDTVLNGFKIDKLSDIEEKNFVLCVTRIKEIKRTKETAK